MMKNECKVLDKNIAYVNLKILSESLLWRYELVADDIFDAVKEEIHEDAVLIFVGDGVRVKTTDDLEEIAGEIRNAFLENVEEPWHASDEEVEDAARAVAKLVIEYLESKYRDREYEAIVYDLYDPEGYGLLFVFDYSYRPRAGNNNDGV